MPRKPRPIMPDESKGETMPDIIDNMPQGPDDPDAWRDEIDEDCVGTDWDCDDGVNGPYDGEVAKCPDCHGTGKST